MTAGILDFTASAELREDLHRWRTRSAVLGVAGLAAVGIGAFFWPGQFFRSWLWSYVFFLGLTLGCMAWLMTQYLTGGAWGVVIRRPAEAAMRTLPLLVLFFLPVAFGIPSLYQWAHADVVARDAVLRQKSLYLNVPFFLVRAAVYFAGWLTISWVLNRNSEAEDREGGLEPHRTMSRLSGPGVLFWGFSVTFMAIDWMMSLQPHWFSTMFGLLVIVGEALSAMSFLIALLVLLFQRRPFSEILTPGHLHDLGKLMLATVMMWAYFSFSQWLIIWAGNLPHEIPWYLRRLSGGWQYVALALILFHFAVPFSLLLSRDLKRNFKLLAYIAVFILLMRFVDVYWLVAPEAHPGALAPSWMDLAAVVGIGGVWLAYFLQQLERRPLLPLNDPNLVETLDHGRE